MISVRLGLVIMMVAAGLLLQGCVSSGQRESKPEKAAVIYADLGLEYLRQGNLDLALSRLERSLELDEGNAAAHQYIAEVYRQMGKADAAETHYRRALRLDNNNPMLLNNYGAFLCERKRFSAAEEFFLRAANAPSYRTPELAYENLALCALEMDDLERARDYFRKALEIRPSLPQSLYQMAEISYRNGEYLSARGFIERYHALGQTRQSLELAIRVEEALGDTAAADNYRELLNTNFSGAGRRSQP